MSETSYVASHFIDCIEDSEFLEEVAKQLLHNGIRVQLDMWNDEGDVESSRDTIIKMAADSSGDMFGTMLDRFKRQLHEKLQELAKQARITDVHVDVKFDRFNT